MRSSRGFVRFVLPALLSLCVVKSSQAQLLVVTQPGDPPAIAHAELAYATGDGTEEVTWLSLRAQRGPIAIVAALPRAAQVQPSLDAWLHALEVTASPNILLPNGATDCGKQNSYVHVTWERGDGVPADELSVQAAEDVVTALGELSLTAPEPLPQAEKYVVWSWPDAAGERTTRTLRIVGGAMPVTFLPGAPFPVLVNSITRGPASFPAELRNDELNVTFVAGKSNSDYRYQARDWFERHTQPLLEMRSRGPLFDWSIYADTVSSPPLMRSYAVAAGRELARLDVDACTEQLRALRDAKAPSPSACGSADDATLALASAGAEQPTLQRFVLSGADTISPDRLQGGGDVNTPVLRASKMDNSACRTEEQLPPIVVAPTPAPVVTQPAPTGGTETVVVDHTVVVDDGYAGDGCGCGSPGRDPYYDDRSHDTFVCTSDTSSSSSADDGCSADSSSSSSSDNSGCSSDTSSTSSDDNSSCSGDSSSSSTSEDSGCSSDSSSSSSSSSDGCSGSSDSSYNGDTCSGSAAPGAERKGQSQASLVGARRARPQRLKTSLWSLAAVALVLPIRRRKRRKHASG